MPVLSLNKPLLFQDLKETLIALRKKAKENGINNLFIISPINIKKNLENITLFNGAYIIYEQRKLNKYDYSGIIYENLLNNKYNINYTIFRSSILEIRTNDKEYKLRNYCPEKFYILNRIIIDWTIKNFNKTYGFIFINSWNNYKEYNYLEPDEIYGYTSINILSKALFNISFEEYNYNLLHLNEKYQIAIQVHLFYEDLIYEIINRTNNMPLKFDLFITIININKKNKIEEYIKKYSKSNNYEIKAVNNIGRDILPFIIQMRYKIKKYKYICHIHTKKSKHKYILGYNWRNYLYDNLLGSKAIISEILGYFENFEKLGFIFPESYYDIIKNINDFNNIEFGLHKVNKKLMNYILKKLFPGFEVGNLLVFPLGNMFWARIKAIHQIFNIRFLKKFPIELNQINDTLMHAIERIWLYLVKKNGFYYKSIFKHY